MKFRFYDVTLVVSAMVEADLEGDEARRVAVETVYDILRDDLWCCVNNADVEATDRYEEEDD